MLEKMGYVIIAMFLITIAGFVWLWNQPPACPEGYDESVQGCKGMPPLPASGVDATDVSDVGSDADTDG